MEKLKLYEKKCCMCGRVFYTIDENEKNCGDISCKKNYIGTNKAKKYKVCKWCGTQHYKKSSFCSDNCEQKHSEMQKRRALCKKLKCKYMKYIGIKCDSNFICDFKLMARFAPDSEKPCEKYKEGDTNDN